MLGGKAISRTVGLVAVGATWVAAAGVAQAHVTLTSPMNRYEDMSYQNEYQKSWPCGHAANPAGTLTPVVYQAGETVTITIDEYVAHTGYIRVAVADSDQDFSDPQDLDALEDPYTVLLVPDTNPAGEFTLDVELPDEPCDPCVLQMIQIMTNGAGNFNDNYYQCADIVIEGSVDGTGGDETGGESTTGDSTTGDSTTSTTSTTGTTTDDSGTTTSTTGDDESTTGEDPTGTGTDTDGGGADDDSGGGCNVAANTGAPGWALLGLFGLVGLRRRRA